MVQAIENWADVSGTVVEVRDSPKRSDLVEVDVDIDATDDVDSYPNLLEPSVGTVVTVTMPARALDATGVSAGDRIRCRAQRRSPDMVMAHPDGVEAGTA